MRGSFDGIDNGRLFGWAEIDGGPVSIDVLIDSQSVSTISSSDERPDLQAAGIGNRAFAIRIPDRFQDGQSHEVALRDNVTRNYILGTPRIIVIEKGEPVASPLVAHADTRTPPNLERTARTASGHGVLQTELAKARVRSRLEKLTLLDPDFYLDSYADLRDANADPLEHYVSHGVYERRNAISQLMVARVIGQIMENFQEHADAYRIDLARSQQSSPTKVAFLKRRSIAVIIHSQANHFMRPIAANLVHALKAAGARAALRTEHDGEVRRTDIPIVVAPHEFFEFELPDYFRSDEFLLRHVSYNTEQLPSPWFSSALRYMMSARALIDINFQSAIALSTALPTLHALPTMNRRSRDTYMLQTDFSHPLFRWMGPEVLSSLNNATQLGERPIDVFLVGHGTPDRAAALARAAPALASKYCFLAYSATPPTTVPFDDETKRLFANYLAVANSSKIVLNLHRYRVGYFEWERMLAQGFLGGAAVITTRCLPSPFFQSGQHYFETNARNVGNLISWLLDSKEGGLARERATRAAAEVMANEVTPLRIGNHIVSFLSSLGKGRHD